MLILSLYPPVQQGVRPAPEFARATGRFGQVIGETCEYLSVLETAHGHIRECRTQDGAVLSEQSYGRGSGSSFTAVSVWRGGATLPSIISQSERLRPARWGLPR